MSWGQRWASPWELGVGQWELGQELACPDTLTPEQTRPEALPRGMKSETPAWPRAPAGPWAPGAVGSAPRRQGRTVPRWGVPCPATSLSLFPASLSTRPLLDGSSSDCSNGSQPSERHSTSSRMAPPQALASRRVYADPRHLVAGGTRLTRGRPSLADCHSRVTPRA